MKAYDIAQQFKALEDLQDFDEETGELLDSEAYYSLLAEIEASREEKLINIEKIKRDIEADNDLIANEIKRLQLRKKRNETKVERLETLQLMLIDGDKIETPFFTFSTRKSESVEISEKIKIEDLPDEFKRIKTVIEPDKKAITKALKGVIPECFYVCDGVEKDGRMYKSLGIILKQNVSLSVR